MGPTMFLRKSRVALSSVICEIALYTASRLLAKAISIANNLYVGSLQWEALQPTRWKRQQRALLHGEATSTFVLIFIQRRPRAAPEPPGGLEKASGPAAGSSMGRASPGISVAVSAQGGAEYATADAPNTSIFPWVSASVSSIYAIGREVIGSILERGLVSS